MKQVREVSYDIGDCFDDVNHRLGREPRGSGALVYFRKKWYLLTTLYARRCIATEIRNLKVRAQHVSDRRTRYGVENLTDKDGGDGGADNGDPTDRLTPPLELIGTKKPVGVEHAIAGLGGWFEEAKRDTQAHKKFLAIYGFGGLGKTTLAEELYTKFGDDYDCRASVQASQKFNLVMLLRSLVNQFQEQQAGASQHVSHDKIEELGQKGLKDMLGDQLKNKRYVLYLHR
uniref:NB-ARC domain-containing protein n=1 Tax=Aegilops tauschii subsp. strangulata TaxID=200361 RepID=A0A453LEU4_AEGTS